MKNTVKKSLLAVAVLLLVAAFTTPLNGIKEINTQTSKVTWKGYKVTGSHEGTIAIKSGSLEFKNETLTGGQFVIDMTTIGATDLQGGSKERLDGHLKSDDFFAVATYPTASMTITNVKETAKNEYTVTGDVTIRDKTNPVTFTMTVKGNTATATMKIDRIKYGVEYRSASIMEGLKDKAIYDEFDLVAELQF